MKNIIYIISLIILIIFSFLINTNKKKDNFLLRSVIIILCLFSVSIFTSLICYFLNIKASLWSFTIINILLSILNILKIAKDKEIQKYKIKAYDIILLLVLIIIIIAIAIINYGIPFKIKYETTDASMHFASAMNFMNEEEILLNYDNDVGQYFRFSTRMIGAYVNEGIFFAIFQNSLENIDFYKLYILFDVFMLFISALVMYEIILQLIKNKKQKYLAIIISLFYMLSYPLNSVLMGCSYLTLSLIYVCGIILIFQLRSKMEIKYFYIILFLLNLGLAHTYTLFAGITFIAEIITLIINERKKAIGIIIISVICSALTILIYFVNNPSEKINMLSQEGPMYRNYYSNMIIYIPIILYTIYKNIKNKVVNVEDIIFIILIITIPILFVLKNKMIISSYYYTKFYYILWVSVIVLFSKGIIYLLEQNLKIGIITFITIVICLTTSFVFCNITYTREETMKDITKENITEISEMFKINYNIIKRQSYILNDEELLILKNLQNQINENKKDIEVIGGLGQINWTYAIFNFSNSYTYGGHAYVKLYEIDSINSKYLLAFKRATIMHKFSEQILERYNYTYEDNFGGWLQNKYKQTE